MKVASDKVFAVALSFRTVLLGFSGGGEGEGLLGSLSKQWECPKFQILRGMEHSRGEEFHWGASLDQSGGSLLRSHRSSVSFVAINICITKSPMSMGVFF